MNPRFYGGPKEPHVYTQEEALELSKENCEKDRVIKDLKSKVESQKEKLDLALSLMEKEQLIEFINNTLF